MIRAGVSIFRCFGNEAVGWLADKTVLDGLVLKAVDGGDDGTKLVFGRGC